MQHKIYWGGLKRPMEWSLKTWLAPWAYIASVVYHDFYWYPFKSRSQMKACLESQWGRLFQNWGEVAETDAGFPEVGAEPARFHRNLTAMLAQSAKVLATCVVQAPEFGASKRRRSH